MSLQIFDRRDMLSYEPALTGNPWLCKQLSEDIPVSELLDAAAAGKINQYYTVAFLIERAELSTQQKRFLAHELADLAPDMGGAYETEINEALEPYATASEAIRSFLALDELCALHKGARPQEYGNVIFGYLSEFFLNEVLYEHVSLLAERMTDNVDARVLNSAFARNFARSSATGLKMAFYHLSRNEEPEKIAKVLTNLSNFVLVNPSDVLGEPITI